jgi:hypothetical protein
MICRPHRADGRDGWVLIRQTEHAAISAKLAQKWGASPFEAVDDRILRAIRHHDDGWNDWDSKIRLAASDGGPISFDEMEWSDTCPIWSNSIDFARQLGSLEAHIVAEHFLKLLSFSHRATNFEAFAGKYTRLSRLWLDDWLAESPEHSAAAASLAVEQLRFFDRLSLWFCCREQVASETHTTAETRQLVLTPAIDRPNAFTADPWPWLDPSVELPVNGYKIPADCEPLQFLDLAAAGEPHRLQFSIGPRMDLGI